MSEEEAKPKGWGSARKFQDEMRAFADRAFGGDYTEQAVYRKAVKEMKELAEAIKEHRPKDEIGLEIADVILALLLLGDMQQRDIGILMRLKLNQIADRKWRKLDDGTWQHVEQCDAEEVSAEEGLDAVPPEDGGAEDVYVQPLPDEDQGGRSLF